MWTGVRSLPNKKWGTGGPPVFSLTNGRAARSPLVLYCIVVDIVHVPTQVRTMNCRMITWIAAALAMTHTEGATSPPATRSNIRAADMLEVIQYGSLDRKLFS